MHNGIVSILGFHTFMLILSRNVKTNTSVHLRFTNF